MFSQTASSPINKENIQECHYICSINNIANILQQGIVSHKRAQKISNRTDISDNAVQNRRASVRVPRSEVDKGRLALHRHAVLYLNAHNAMMYVRRDQHENLCVLRIHREVLDRSDARLSSRNASTNAANFFSPQRNPLYSPRSTGYLAAASSTSWDGDNEERKQVRQAEVLLPYKIDSGFIGGIFVSNQETKDVVQAILNELNITSIEITVHPSLFFQGKTRFISLAEFTPLPALSEDELAAIDFTLPDSDSSKTNSDVDEYEQDSDDRSMSLSALSFGSGKK